MQIPLKQGFASLSNSREGDFVKNAKFSNYKTLFRADIIKTRHFLQECQLTPRNK